MNFTLTAKTLIVSVLFLSSTLFAQCENMYYNGYKPDTFKDKKVTEICYEEYGLAYSTKPGLLGPVFAAEHLTSNQLEKAQGMKRKNTFHEEPSLNIFHKLMLSDFKGSGYDRGHLAPNADFSNEQSQYECFSLANMVYQSPENNQGIWSKLEGFTRHLAFKNKEIYILTGPMFDSNSQSIADNRTKVPSFIWKVIYIPSTNSGIAIVTTNDAESTLTKMKISDFEKKIGIKFFENSSKFKLLDISEFRFDKNNQKHSSREKSNSNEELILKGMKLLF